MNKGNLYKKIYSGECHYCDYWSRGRCTGRKCYKYKKTVKRYKKRKKIKGYKHEETYIRQL